VRVVEDVAGLPWFVARDVCDALGIANHSHAVSRLDEDEKGVANSDTLGGTQQVTTVNEAGLYSLTLTSRKPEAKRFKRWITHEVLPALRRTGRYSMVGTGAAEATPDMPLAANHRADIVVSASRSFAAMMRTGQLLGLGRRHAARHANAAAALLTGVNLAELLDAEDLLEEPEALAKLNPALDRLRAWLDSRSEVRPSEVAAALGLPAGLKTTEMRVAALLREAGWVKHRALRDGVRTTLYISAEAAEGAFA
jgi:prophage antirepressor-like protein